MSNPEDIDCQICSKRHHRDTCPMVKKMPEMTLVFCDLCGCHYTDKCPNHGARKIC